MRGLKESGGSCIWPILMVLHLLGTAMSTLSRIRVDVTRFPSLVGQDLDDPKLLDLAM